MIFYIAGPISGIPNGNKEAFFKAESILKLSGSPVLNPASLPDGLPEGTYMDICLAMIRGSSAIYMLPGWSGSKGATTEYHYAKKLGLVVYAENSFLDRAAFIEQ